MNRRLERGRATRQHLIDAATRLFTEHGYEAVSIERILRATAISKGALYHHFRGKEAVFIAVLEEVERRTAARLVEAATGASSPLDALRAGAAAWLDLAATDASVRRIVLLDAPAAIGWAAWREIGSRYTLGLIRNVLSAAAQAGHLEAEMVDVHAHVVMAILIETASLIAREPEAAGRAKRIMGAVDGVLLSLFRRQ